MSNLKVMSPTAAIVDTCEWSTDLDDGGIMSKFAKQLVSRIKKTMGLRLSGRAASLEMGTP